MILKPTLNYSIVIADDDVDDQFLIKQAINEINQECDLFSVHNGIQLMDLLLRRGKYTVDPPFVPDIILLDLNMPLLDGFSVLSQIRASDHLKNIPTFVLSTSRALRDVERSLALGANAFYSKPAEFSQLKKIVSEICQIISLVKS